MEEIWNYNVCARDGKIHLAFGAAASSSLNQNRELEVYLDPDGEMEIDLYRDDGNVHVITTGASYVEKILWISTYLAAAATMDATGVGILTTTAAFRHFNNNLKARSGQEAWFCSDKGVGVCLDADTYTWVTYTPDGNSRSGKAMLKGETDAQSGGQGLQCAAPVHHLCRLRW